MVLVSSWSLFIIDGTCQCKSSHSFPRGTVRYPRAGPEWEQVAGDGYIYVTDRSITPAAWVSHVRRCIPPAVIDFRQAGRAWAKQNRARSAGQTALIELPGDVLPFDENGGRKSQTIPFTVGEGENQFCGTQQLVQ